MQQSRSATMTEGPIVWSLLKLALPMLFGVFGMVAFNLADTYFVGQLGTHHLAALSFTFPVVLVVGSITMGLGVAVSALVSRSIGEGNHYKMQRLTTDGLMLCLLIAILVIIVGLSTIDPLFRALGATEELLPLIKEYMYIWYPGVLLMIIPMLGNNAIRATGDTMTPGMVMLAAVVVNILLDPLLIFGIGPFPRMEMSGAALATALARVIPLVIALWVLIWRERMLTFVRPRLAEVLNSWRDILSIGLPAATTNIIIPITIGVITRLVSTYGHEAVAAFGAASRFDMFAFIALMALSAVLAPFVGQNWGAGLNERVDRALTYSQHFALVWGAAIFIVLMAVGRGAASLFTDNPEVASIMRTYFWIVPLGYGFQGVIHLSNSVLNVLHRPLQAVALVIIQTLVLHIPLAYLGSYLIGLPGIFASTVVAHTLTGMVAYFWLTRVIRRLETLPGPVVVPENASSSYLEG